MTKGIFIMFVFLLAILGGYYFFGFSVSNRQNTETILRNENIQGDPSSSEIGTPSSSTSSISLPTPEVTKCKITGCSSQICSDKDVTTDCMYREEYVCYQKAKCEKQKNGTCGWTKNPEIEACLLQYE